MDQARIRKGNKKRTQEEDFVAWKARWLRRGNEGSSRRRELRRWHAKVGERTRGEDGITASLRPSMYTVQSSTLRVAVRSHRI